MPRMKGSQFTQKQKDAIRALIEAKPGESIIQIAKRAGQGRKTIYEDLMIPELVAAVEAGKRRKEKIGRTSLEGAKKGVEALHTILAKLTLKMENNEAISDTEVAKIMQLTNSLFTVASKAAELGLDVDIDMAPQELEYDATKEIEAAIKFGMCLVLLPPEAQEEQLEVALDTFRKKGTLIDLKSLPEPPTPQYQCLPSPTELPEPDTLLISQPEELTVIPPPTLEAEIVKE